MTWADDYAPLGCNLLHKSLTSLCWQCKVEVIVSQWLHFLTDGKCNQCSNHNFQLLHSGGHYDFGSRPQSHLLPKRAGQHSLRELHKLKCQETGSWMYKSAGYLYWEVATFFLSENQIFNNNFYSMQLHLGDHSLRHLFFFKFASVKQTVIQVMKTITKVARCWNSNDANTQRQRHFKFVSYQYMIIAYTELSCLLDSRM